MVDWNFGGGNNGSGVSGIAGVSGGISPSPVGVCGGGGTITLPTPPNGVVEISSSILMSPSSPVPVTVTLSPGVYPIPGLMYGNVC